MAYGLAIDPTTNNEVEQPWIAQVEIAFQKPKNKFQVHYLEKLFGQTYARWEDVVILNSSQIVGPVRIHKSVSSFLTSQLLINHFMNRKMNLY